MSAPFYTPPRSVKQVQAPHQPRIDAPAGALGAPSPEPEAPSPEVETPKGNRFIRWLAEKANPITLFVVLIGIAVVLAVVVALIDPNRGLDWLLGYNTISGKDVLDVGIALAPLLALALAIERIIETSFDMFERATHQIAELGQIGEDGYRHIMAEQERYQKAFNDVTISMEYESDPAIIEKMEKERDALLLKMARTREWIDNIPRDPRYISFKRMLSIWLGLLMGLVISIMISDDTGIFGYLNIRVPLMLEMIVTGFVIGAGSGPMHSLIGALQGLKDTLVGLGQLAGLGQVKQEVRELQEKVQ